jgi:hypothetical protein
VWSKASFLARGDLATATLEIIGQNRKILIHDKIRCAGGGTFLEEDDEEDALSHG